MTVLVGKRLVVCKLRKPFGPIHRTRKVHQLEHTSSAKLIAR
jgi:hypothetical protein